MADSFYSSNFSSTLPNISNASTPTPYSAPPPPPKSSYTLQSSSSAQPSGHYNHPQLPSYPASPAPPPLPSQQALSPATQPEVSYQQNPTPQQSYSSHSQSSLPTHFELPPNIIAHTTTDLTALLSSPSLLTSLAQTHPSYTSSLEPLQSQIAANLALSSQLAETETVLKSLRDQTTQLLLQHTSLQTQWRRKQRELDEALAPWGPRAMYARLTAGITEQEGLVRGVYERFLEDSSGMALHGEGREDGKANEKEVGEWVKRIREGVVVLEKRREMRARWDEGRVGGWR